MKQLIYRCPDTSAPGQLTGVHKAIYKTRPGYDSRNRRSFNRFLKVSTEQRWCWGDISR